MMSSLDVASWPGRERFPDDANRTHANEVTTMARKQRQTIEPEQNGTIVTVEDGVEYLVLRLPDGTNVDISVDPPNENKHIKIYDDNDYSVMALDKNSRVKPLEVWNGPVESSTRRGTVPGPAVTVPRSDGRFPDEDVVNECVWCGDEFDGWKPGDPPVCGQECWTQLRLASEEELEHRES
jgi:hypothetical protein